MASNVSTLKIFDAVNVHKCPPLLKMLKGKVFNHFTTTTFLFFQVTWLRHGHRTPIPLVLGLNNITNVKDPRITALHSPSNPEEFVLRIMHTRLSDRGRYECQVSGKPKAIYRVMKLDIVGEYFLSTP